MRPSSTGPLALLLATLVACSPPTPTATPTPTPTPPPTSMPTATPAATASATPVPDLASTAVPSTPPQAPTPTPTATPLPPTPTSPAEVLGGPSLTTMPLLTIRPTSEVQVESLSRDSAEARAMLERNLIDSLGMLSQGVREGCTLTVSQDFFSLISSDNRILERTRKLRAILTPDEGKRWLIRGRTEDFVEDGRSWTREF